MLEKIVVISFIVFAIYATMGEGEIFGIVREWYYKLTDKWSEEKQEFWSNPVFACPVCMAPYYGSVAYWLIFHNSWQEWVITIIGAMGLNQIIVDLSPKKD